MGFSCGEAVEPLPVAPGDEFPPKAQPVKILNGIRGWLLVFYILELLPLLSNIFDLMLFLSSGGTLISITTLSLVVSIAFLAAILVLMHLRNIQFCTVYVIHVGLSFLLLIVLRALGGSIGRGVPALGDLFWIFYLFVSERMKITFHLKPDPAADATSDDTQNVSRSSQRKSAIHPQKQFI